MRAFGEGFCVNRPPIDTNTVKPVIHRKPNGNASVVLNFITPHQKWDPSTTPMMLMLTLSRRTVSGSRSTPRPPASSTMTG